MFGLTKESALVSVADGREVRLALAALLKAVQEREQRETEEKGLISIVDGSANGWTPSRDEEARQRLHVRRGTQNLWYLPEADDARQVETELRSRLQAAETAERERLAKEAMARLKTLCAKLCPVLIESMEIAKEIERLRQEVGVAGHDMGEHPASALLPGSSLVAWQYEKMKEKGLL